MKLIIASNNAHKIREIKAILGGRFDQVLSMQEAGLDMEIEENGTTFRENALIKARAVADAAGCAALADDSGLSVGALNGAPGGPGVLDDLEAQRMQGGEAGRPRKGILKKLVKAPAHVAGRRAVEGQRHDVRRLRSAGGDQPGHPGYQHRGFAGPRDGNDQKRTPFVADGGPLLRVQANMMA